MADPADATGAQRIMKPCQKSGARRHPFGSYYGMADESTNAVEMLRQSSGDPEALGRVWDQYRARLRRLVRLRLDRRLQGRIDPSDVLQEACLEAATRLDDFLGQAEMPFYLWLRFLIGQKLLQLHRHHLGAQARDASREVSLYRGSI